MQTDLEFLLHSLGIDTVILADQHDHLHSLHGFQATNRDFRVVIAARDAVDSMDGRRCSFSLRLMRPQWDGAMTNPEILESLKS
jgi:hypothetical protein